MDSARAQIEIYDQYKDLDEDFTVEDWIDKWTDMLRKNKFDKWLLKLRKNSSISYLVRRVKTNE